ncbi:hypothetical protein NLU13_7587 [Sarocladium strictum]|uniref:Enoyl reductase (ER) domain-containing protein n=1 Tax=Sarocladium strictum TaxID=5046 RepID=A0AA39GDS7_SARSR|nr:hypothetical protein NLU13_7587 [Sarocladium strictum]
MQAVVITDFCETLAEVKVSSIPQPRPKPDELLIKVCAAGVNFVDTLYARGKHQNNRELVRPPFTLGLEFAGIVIKTPPSSLYQAGDSVFGNYSGSFAEYICLPADSLAVQKTPSQWSHVSAAGIAATLPVSYDALARRAAIQPGETILVHAAAGGLGAMAVQVAVALGCTVIGTAGSAERCAYAKKLGARVCVDYTQESWHQAVLDATEGKGVDVVFDPVGLVDLSMKCIAHRGRVVIAGFAGREGNMEKVATNRILLKQVQLIGYRYGETLRRDPTERERVWNELEPLIEGGKIRPTVGKLYKGLESVREALQDLADRKIMGKAIIEMGGQVHRQDGLSPRL